VVVEVLPVVVAGREVLDEADLLERRGVAVHHGDALGDAGDDLVEGLVLAVDDHDVEAALLEVRDGGFQFLVGWEFVE